MTRLRAFVPAPRDLLTWALVAFLLLTYLQVVGVDQVDLYLLWARRLAEGADPYGTPAGYPPLAMFAMALPEPASPDVGAYRLWFAAGVLVAFLAGLCVAAYAERRSGRPGVALAFTVAVGAMGTNLLLSRYDLAPAVLSLAALVALQRGRGGWAAAALGVGIALKPYLLVLVPLLAVWELRRTGVRAALPGRLALGAGWLVAPSVVAVLAMAPISGLHDATSAYGFQVTRAATQDSAPAVVVAAIAPLGFEQRASFDRGCGCRVRTGEAMGAVRGAATLALALGLLTLIALAWRRPDAGTLVVAANAALALLLLGYAVFSPQYMVWLGAPICLLAGRRAGWVAIGATAVATAAAAYSYHLHYGEVIAFSGTGRDLVVLRVLAQLVALGALVALLRRPDREAVRRDVAVGSATS